MFDRNVESWHDLNPVKPEHRELYKDDFSAKYLAQVYYPDFALRMKQQNKPVIGFGGSIAGRRLNHKNERWIF